MKTQPNVIFILSDQHNAKVLGHKGHPDAQTPNIEDSRHNDSHLCVSFLTMQILLLLPCEPGLRLLPECKRDQRHRWSQENQIQPACIE